MCLLVAFDTCELRPSRRANGATVASGVALAGPVLPCACIEYRAEAVDPFRRAVTEQRDAVMQRIRRFTTIALRQVVAKICDGIERVKGPYLDFGVRITTEVLAERIAYAL